MSTTTCWQVDYGAPPSYAVSLRLPQSVLDDVMAAAARGEACSLSLGEGDTPATLTFGANALPLTCHTEQRTVDVLRLDDGGGTGERIAAVAKRLVAQRTLDPLERARARARAAEAERERKARKLQKLERIPSRPGRGTGVVRVAGSTPPPLPMARAGVGGGGTGLARAPAKRPTPPPPAAGLLRSPSPAVRPHGTPPPGGVGGLSPAVPPRGTPPPPPAARAGPKPKRRQTQTPTPEPAADVPAAALVGARESLADCLVALLDARPASEKGVARSLLGVAAAVPGFSVPPQKTLQFALREVGEFRAPGLWFLHAEWADKAAQLREAAATVAAASSKHGVANGNGSASGGAGAGGRGGGRGGGSGAVTASPGGDKTVHARARAASPSPPPAAPAFALGPLQSSPTPPPVRVRVKKPRLDSKAGGTGPGEAGGVDRGNAGGADYGVPATVVPAAAAGPPPARPPSPWYAVHVGRAPTLVPPPADGAAFAALCHAYAEKHRVYTSLHRDLRAHRRAVSDLVAARGAATDAREAAAWEARAAGLLARDGVRADAQRAAFDVLHRELRHERELIAAYQAAEGVGEAGGEGGR